MKKLSDYKGEEAINLWANLLEPFTTILSDENVANAIRTKKAPLIIAGEILKKYQSEAIQILNCIDDSPIDGLNIVVRLVGLLVEIGSNEEIRNFFGFAEQGKTAKGFSGSVTENTEDDLK